VRHVSDQREVEPLPLSALNHLLYCERRCALIHIEGVFVENAATLAGRLAHEGADTPGYETRAGVRVERALPLFSDVLGLSGKADIVEFHPSAGKGDRERPFPVEYKRGPRRKWENDDVQLCAQAMCLEEMLGVPVPDGAVFHAKTKRRRDVIFTPELRAQTLEAIRRLRELIDVARVPPAILKPQCEGCSLHEVCMPELSGDDRVWRAATEGLFTGAEDS
jgi:CRISPR-associated exonuclease Cas4